MILLALPVASGNKIIRYCRISLIRRAGS